MNKFFLMIITENSAYNMIAFSSFHSKHFEVENFLDFPNLTLNSKVIGTINNGKVRLVKIKIA